VSLDAGKLDARGAIASLLAPRARRIESARLTLIPASIASLSAEVAGDIARLAASLRVAAPEAWPPDLYDSEAMAWSLHALRQPSFRPPWCTYYFALKTGKAPILVGAGGFVRAPGEEGEAELGYSILAAHRRRGYASEATQALVARASSERGVRRVIAQTYPDLVASIGVLEKCGFHRDGPGEEAGTVRYVRNLR
jgi:[ribosomal protein S5]-alanine N-acetyltransferase